MQALHHGALLPAGSGGKYSIAAKYLEWQQRIYQCTAAPQCRPLPSTNGQQCQRQYQQQQQCQAANIGRRCPHAAAQAAASELSADSSSMRDHHAQQQQQQLQQQSGIPAVGAEVVVDCDRLGTEGVGVCTVPPSRFVLLIKGALPGEQLLAKITTVKKGYAEGFKLSTVRPHNNAVNPGCQHFGPCGGCSLQTLAYDAQLAHKVEHVTQLLTRVGKLNPDLVAATRLNPIAAPADQQYGYRNKIQLAFSSWVWQPEASSGTISCNATTTISSGHGHTVTADGLAGVNSNTAVGTDVSQASNSGGRVVKGYGLGFYRPGSNQVVMPVEECSLVGPEVNQVIRAVRRCCQQHALQPHNPATGQGQLRHLIMRTASALTPADSGGDSNGTAACAAVSSSSSSSNPSLPAVQIMAVLVTTEACESSQLQAVADQLLQECSDLGLVSVVHSIEAAASGQTASGHPDCEHPLSSPRASAPQQATKAIARSRPGRKGKSSKGQDGLNSNNSSNNSSRNNGTHQQHRSARALSVSSSRVLCGAPFLTEQLCGLQFHISPHSFFQTNTRQAERLYGRVVEAVQEYYQGTAQGETQAGSGLHSGVVLDLYTGTGTIALSLASSKCCQQVIGFDVSESSIRDGRANAALNGISNAHFVCGDLNQLARGELLGPGIKPDVVVVDPARAGLGKNVVDYLLRCAAERLVYVSCNAATQARDLQLLCKGDHGERFNVTSWIAVDMYPQTGVEHVETVIVFNKM